MNLKHREKGFYPQKYPQVMEDFPQVVDNFCPFFSIAAEIGYND